mmetsp:Transcript_36888/g.42500  ORF Transcript_36888/g.42500 Transcript_36888/m.42500 type:complete len:249 (+) Transcript_36888:164-910(+)
MEKGTLASGTAPAENIPQHVEEKGIDGDDGDEERLPFRTRMYEAERFITFTDAVVAIAMTLLILPLMDAATELGEDKDESISEFFSDNEDKLISFAVSFFIVAHLWLLGDQLTRYVGSFTRLMTILNFLWMFGIVCIPVGSSLMAHSPDNNYAVIVWVAPMLLTASASLLMCVIMRKDKRTLKGGKGPGVLLLIECGVSVFFIVIALLLCWFVPRLDVYVFLIIFLVAPIKRVIGHMYPSLAHEEYVK